METVLKTTDLTKIYGGKRVVDKVNMTVRRGDIYGFIGKNGAGKTTLIKMMTGLVAPTSGSFELFGATASAEQRRRIGAMIEAPALHPSMSAKDNLELYLRLLGISSKNRAEEVLEMVGLTDTGTKKTKSFSMGMKQRLGIAIALLGNPDFLVLDEPINLLDPTGMKQIRELLQRLNRENGITILMSSHILGEMSKIATCYGIINNGSLVDEFSAGDLENRCKRCLKIKVDDTRRATNILETILNTSNYDVLPDNTIRLFDMLDETGFVNSELVTNGVSVEGLAVTGQDLEGYFMELMGGAGIVGAKG